ncbi:MAG: alpha-L-rhamnosidase C-terminal domain-containing protein [Parabacteroides sp.]|nr:alpha-L-rhamnosidase C-terminal domain-containing protein [Parabacteroides sp.]
MIRSEWKREGKSISMEVEIPAGTTATVFADKEYTVGSGVHSFIIK